MAIENYPKSGIPIRRTVDLLPQVFKTDANSKFMAGVVDPLIQPGSLDKTVGYFGRRYGKTFNSNDIYLDTDQTLRSRYQLEPGVTIRDNKQKVENFYDYLDFKNQLKFFNNKIERDDLITDQDHYSWDPPIDWDKFVNFREYYWVPDGPPAIKITGQSQSITSTYRVRQGTTSTWIFFPDGLTNNPTITLYRGQTYKFQVNSPNEPFVIKTNYDTGSLLYKPYLPYNKGQLAVYDNKLWRAKQYIPVSDQSTIDEFNENWEYVESASSATALDYNKGVTNNGVTNGTLTFQVPLDAPDVLFYQSATDINRFGRFIIGNIENSTLINVGAEILGKATYKSSNGITFSNGMKIIFEGKVIPEKYNKDTWIVEGVGESIQLVRFQDLIPPSLSTPSLEILFDDGGFDTEPFDDAINYPEISDYVSINRSSKDLNPWSRYNRWFHRSVLELAHELNGSDFTAEEKNRAKRPIIEFKQNLKLYNHGEVAKESVDFIDTFTTDVFSTIEGSLGYNIDGEELFQGARVLVVADTDSLANNKIYQVNFIVHNGRKQINLIQTIDTVSQIHEGVFIKRGNQYRGTMWHFDGTKWSQSQLKNSTNQSPLFDVFDENEISLSDQDTYPVSTFIGSKILSYKVGNSVIDPELGFSLSYLNIDNVGDIEFNFDWDVEKFEYQINKQNFTKDIKTGFYKFTDKNVYFNSWIKTNRKYLQPIIYSTVITDDSSSFIDKSINYNDIEDSDIDKILIYVNGIKYLGSYTRVKNLYILENNLKIGDTVTIKIYCNTSPDQGYYEIPLGLEKNPLNQEIQTFTLGQAIDHVSTALDLFDIFEGSYPGNSNLRDITGFQNLGKRFLKHSGISPAVITLLCDKKINLIKSIQYAKKSYTDFKNNFLIFSQSLSFDGNIVDFVDNILLEMNKVKSNNDSFSDSDMVGTGAYSVKNYTVEDTGIKTFALSEKFSLDELSRKSVYIYKNNVQLLNKKDYKFNDSFGFVELLIDLAEGDFIQIREYVSTSFCFIPPTPTKLGLYKKYLPRKFLDDTYQNPVEVIEGHDGSKTVAYNDFRDDLLLELEKRIYNNLKQEYNKKLFDIDNIIGSYYYSPYYNKNDVDDVIFYDFLKWLQNTNIDYLNNTYYDEGDSFTYTYSQMADPTGTINLPGWWRGVYKWFYDTDRPHTCPWEMLGFTEKPDWWESEYGPAPYTKNNLVLWEDIAAGIIKQGINAGTYNRYKRSTILDHIPVDGDGKLLSPFDTGLARNFVLINNTGTFQFSDHGPVESAWRTSSEYPFAIVSALCLMKPFEFIFESLDRSRIKINKIDQTVNVNTGLFYKINDILFPEVGNTQTSGLLNYIVDYLKFKGQTVDLLKNKINNIDVNLSVRMSGFVDQQQQKFLLDSKNPRSTTSSIFVPPENYDIIFNVSAPIASPSYSGIIVEKVENGYKIYGYDNFEPYFTVFKPLRSEKDQIVSVGGISENFVEWQPNTQYSNGTIVRVNDIFYRALKSQTSGDVFDSSTWQRLAKLPIINALEVFKRRNWQKATSRIAYGTVVSTNQDVADIMFGYEQYLLSQGFEFNGYDTKLETPKNWETSVKEFLFWTRHKWALGSLISLSPLAEQLVLNINVGVADNLLDSFYDYNILKDDGNVLYSEFINVNREFKKITINTVNTENGIYFFKCYFVLKEHVTLFTDRTVFNDVIYDKPTGYRQERIKARGFRTLDWDGDYTSPGFVFDNVNIQVWQPFVNYRLGDIVSYKSYNWTSLVNQQGTDKFDDSKWSKLDTTPEKSLVKNFDFNIELISDFYNVESDGVGSSQRDLARHLTGYQVREYLQNLAEDSVTQFRLYQGFIKEKGTKNSVIKIFDKISKTIDDSIVINEEWAIQTGKLGGVDQINEIEFLINKKDLVVNPQPILIIEGPKPDNQLDRYLRVNQVDFTKSLLPYSSSINPIQPYEGLSRDAGYVRVDQVEKIFKNEEELLATDIQTINENDHLWITFYNNSWNVFRINLSKSLIIFGIDRDEEYVYITYNQPLQFAPGDIIGIKGLNLLDGFHKIVAAEGYVVTIPLPTIFVTPEIPDTSSLQYNTWLLSAARYKNYQEVNQESTALLADKSKIFIDNSDNELNNWQVIEKQKIYNYKSITNFGSTDPRHVGKDVEYVPSQDTVISGIPTANIAVSYKENEAGLSPKQIIFPETGYESYLNNSFGDAIAVSPDGVWMAISAPLASGVPNKFKGYFSVAGQYMAGDLVLYNGILWESLNEQNTLAFDPQDDGSTDTLNFISSKFRDLDWKIATLVTGNLTGSPGPSNQGAVFLYRYSNNQWSHEYTLLSPRIASGEKFGHKVSISVSGNDYYMAISAPGALENLGRVYLYKYTGSGSQTVQQVLTVTGNVAVNYGTNIITFSRDHNYTTGQPLQYINGTYGGDDKSTATAPPPPEDYTTLYAIRIDSRRIQLASSVEDAASATAIDLRNFGIDDSSSHTFISNFITGWTFLENINYRGLYNTSTLAIYAKDSIVWYEGKLYQALQETAGSTQPLQNNVNWELLEDAATHNSLPSNIALVETPTDGPTTDSTLEVGSVYPIVTADKIIVGQIYTIIDFGNTDFQSLGYNPAADNLTFKAEKVGFGTGTVRWISYQFSELVNPGDMFGYSIAMNRDGTILVVGSPEADGQYFANYKGPWKSYQTYYEDDVVKYNGAFYQLRDTSVDSSNFDSTIISNKNVVPTSGDPWYLLQENAALSVGKVFIYQRNEYDVYRLRQSITNGSLDEISDMSSNEDLKGGDNFGFSVDIDHTGTTIIVSSPKADLGYNDQGAVYVFKTADSNLIEYRLKQKLQSFETYANEFFGTDVSISSGTEKIVIGAKNAVFRLPLYFDNLETTFDGRNTKFYSEEGNTGQAYVFERKDQTYFLSEKLYADNFQDWESFGSSVDCHGNVIVIGSPNFRNNFYRVLNNVSVTGGPPGSENLTVNLILFNGTVINVEVNNEGSLYVVNDLDDINDVLTIPGSTTGDNAKIKITSVNGSGGAVSIFLVYNGSNYVSPAEIIETGNVRLFKKDANKTSLNLIANREDLVDIEVFNSISLYDNVNNIKLDDLQIVDHYKFKILSQADKEITFKTMYDPAVYTNGNEQQEVDEPLAWFEKHVGELWWDLSTVKFLNYEQGDISYRAGNWNKQVYGSSIDIYEWVETIYLPSQWLALADTNEGLSLGISGQPLYTDDSVYSIKILTNPNTGETTDTKYYYWVKNKVIIPSDVPGRKLSAFDVANYISNPIASGIQFISPVDKDKFIAFNFNSIINSDTALINIQYKKQKKNLNPVHFEYQLLTEEVADSLPNDLLENKWLDSLVGYDRSGKSVPDITIPEKQRYGLAIRPRQSMFKNRFPILKTSLENINNVLSKKAFSDTLNFRNLSLVEDIPDSVLNEYDQVVDTLIDLDQVGTTRVRKAILSANIVDGEIDTIDIIDSGFGYKNTPFITIEGDGTGAYAEITTDNQGRVSNVSVVSKGRNYTTAIVQIRYFSVLVKFDESIRNYWSIYAWDDVRKTFFRSRSQAYDTTKYWEYVDFWKEGFGITSRIVKELTNFYEEPSISLEVDELLRIKEFGSGGWAVLQKTEPGTGDIAENYNLVGRYNGTIRIKVEELAGNVKVGYDRTASFDSDSYDLNPTAELRNILRAAKDDIFINELRVEWNKLFFTSLRYVFVEQQYVDWAFKTSFVNGIHNVGNLLQKINYKNDNLDSFLEYINEIKPYRTTIREYVSKYSNLDMGMMSTTDFDLPPYYSAIDNNILPVSEDSSLLEKYPYKWWADNNGYSIVDIQITNKGSGYVEPPTVLIDGNGIDAKAQAYISNGSVSGIKMISTGSGYKKLPTISLVGGNGTNQDKAKAVAVLGNTPVRTIDVGIKFDRISKQGFFEEFSVSETFTGNGISSVFELKYAPNRDKSKITVTINGDIVLSTDYTLTLYYKKTNGYSLLSGKLKFVKTPIIGDSIVVTYEKNIELFDAINRISSKYAPTEGMKGNEPVQLMTGLDFGGVQIQGTTFDVTGGWDALPWFTDNWDSVEPNSDYYYIADGSTISVTLPYTPAVGEQISIYWKPVGNSVPSNINTIGSSTSPQVIELPEVPAPKTVRIDDPNWTPAWDSSNVTNPNAQMPTFVGDGSTRVVEVGNYISVQAGDTLIFRKLDSDGSVTISDPNLLDTIVSGGSLSAISGAYVTATGKTPEEIVIDGDKFISPDQVPAPEENVPGQVLESVSIKVYQTVYQGAAPLQNRIIYADGATKRYKIGLTILEDKSVMVYVNKVKQQKTLVNSSLDYDIDYQNNEIVFTYVPTAGSIIEIISFGIGGVELLDYQEFIADGNTFLFLTKAVYNQTQSVFVTVDGSAIDTGYLNSEDYTDVKNRTIIQFGIAPANGAVIKVICLGAPLDTDSSQQSIVRVNQQVFYYDGSSTKFELDKFVNLSRASAVSNILVNLNGQQLNGPENYITKYDGTNNNIQLGLDPVRYSGYVTYITAEVYINNRKLVPVVDWTLNTITNILTVRSDLLIQDDVIRVVVNSLADYTLDGDNLMLSESIMSTLNNNDDSTIKDTIEVTWFSEYPNMDIVTDQYSGGKVNYKLSRTPVNESYVWVYLNGTRLTLNQDYKVSIPRSVVYLNVNSSLTDEIKIVEFGNELWAFPSAYEIYKDMLNRYYFKRFSNNEITLDKDLNYYDNSITVTNGDKLYDPTGRMVPGVVYINNERIEYLQKSGNILSQLRRGSTGTAIAELHAKGSYVSDAGPLETLPYNEQQNRQDFISDGSTLLVGPVDFIPLKSTRNSWYKETIPTDYGPCDQIEVFVAGTRLRKNPIFVWDESLGSPGADKQIEAEFSVDGASPYIRLTKSVPAGTRITVIRRTGNTWYDRGISTATSGKTMKENNSAIIKFILQKGTIIPE